MLSLKNQPGSVYLASLSAAAHQVLHQDEGDGEELLRVNDDDTDRCRVVVLFRCHTFRHCRGTLHPTPAIVFHTAQHVVSKWQASCGLVIPALEDCKAALGIISASP
jgi:hypothetical protein